MASDIPHLARDQGAAFAVVAVGRKADLEIEKDRSIYQTRRREVVKKENERLTRDTVQNRNTANRRPMRPVVATNASALDCRDPKNTCQQRLSRLQKLAGALGK